jgi:hypothetical protein
MRQIGGEMAGKKVEALGYCGARCPTCFAYKKTVSEAAKALRRELRGENEGRG